MEVLRAAASPGPAPVVGHLAETYRWIPILGGFVAFAWAMSVGAVEVPISFGPAVGSGALTLPQAVLMASVLEITGAVLLGSRETDTLLVKVMRERPPGADDALLMWGLFLALLLSGIWLAVAVYWELPVSSTVPLWGAIIGVLLSVNGVASVYWNRSEQESVLRVGGVTSIVLSWILVPAMAALVSFSLFSLTKLFLLTARHSVTRTLRAMPIYYGVTVTVLIYFLIYRGCPRVGWGDFNLPTASIIAVLSGCVASFLAYVIVLPLVHNRMASFDPRGRGMESGSSKQLQGEERKVEAPPTTSPEPTPTPTPEDLIQQFNDRKVLATVYEGDEEEQLSMDAEVKVMKASPSARSSVSFGQLMVHTPTRLHSFQRLRTEASQSSVQSFRESVSRMSSSTFSRRFVYDRQTLSRHARADKFDAKAEELFSFLQILTACAASFAHGSNEVAWAMGPYSAILQIYDDSKVSGDGRVQSWVLSLGGVGVSLGFALWGWKVVRALGGRLIYMSPARGFSAQLTAVAVVLMASKTHLPASTTHILIGAIVGVGLADSASLLNWPLLSSFFLAWAAILLLSCATSAALFSFTVFSPSYTTG